jgi:hypothetical protein
MGSEDSKIDLQVDRKKIAFLEIFGHLMLELSRDANLNKSRKLTSGTAFDPSADIVRAFLRLTWLK